MDTDTIRTTSIGVPRGTRLAVLGLLMVSAAGAIWLIAGLIWGLDLGESAGFLIPTIVLPAVAAGLVWRFGTWAKVVGIVVALLGLGTLWFTAFGLLEPDSVFDFVGGLLVVPGAVIAIVGCVQAIRAARRGDLRERREGGEARAINVVLAVVVGLTVLSAIFTFVGRSTADATQADAEVAIKDFSFESGGAEEVTVAGGDTLFVVNDDPFHHTFTVEELGIDVQFGPSSQELIEVPAQPGTYTLFCRPHTTNPDDPAEGDMATTLTVG
ncbi:MAG TPA: cupredoxin domain-containing protein [Actinomycetota bacterium]|nr:cupredoxin domain-containing protein [Actinomycetota bacterium]